MTILLDWKSQKDDIYGKKHYAKIWQNQIIEIKNNGENFFNVSLHHSQFGRDIDYIDGAATLKKAKENAKQWIKQQIQPIFLEEI